MGFETLGLRGRHAIDDWEARPGLLGRRELSGSPNEQAYSDEEGKLEKPLAAVQMGLIYVNPEGPNGNGGSSCPRLADIRESFGRMAMNDEEIVALIAGGHTLRQERTALTTRQTASGGIPSARRKSKQQGLGWNNKCGKGNAEDTMTSGLEGAWTATPTAWSSF